MVLSSMIGGCSLWPLWLEVTELFATLLLQLGKSPWPLMPRTEPDTWRQMLFFQCCHPGSCPGFLLSPLQPNRVAALRHSVGIEGMRFFWGLGKDLRGLMQGRRNFPNPKHLGPPVQCCSSRRMLGENLIKAKSELEVPWVPPVFTCPEIPSSYNPLHPAWYLLC